MKIHQVSLTGFGPFRGTEVVDFDAFAGDGKFLITGKTGAGKSTILDAITFALFGHVPRYGSVTDARVRSDYLTHTSEITQVVLEFSTGQARYRVTRRPGYSVPGRKTPLAPFAEIEELRDEGWEVLASRRLTDVSRKIDDVVRLSASQFQQVILLAQGQFEEFLVADSAKRRSLLRQLFDTGRFLDYSTQLDERAAELSKGLAHTTAAVETTLGHLAAVVGQPAPDLLGAHRSAQVLAWAEQLQKEQEALLVSEQAAADQARAALTAARSELKLGETTVRAQQRRRETEERLVALEAQIDDVAAEQVRLRAAHDAEAVWTSIEAHRNAESKCREAESVLAESRRSHDEVLQEVVDDLEGTALAEWLRERETSLVADEARLAELARSESAVRTLAQRLESAKASYDAALVDLTRIEAEREELVRSVPELDESIAALVTVHRDLHAAEKTLESLQARLSAAEIARQTDKELAAALAVRRGTSDEVETCAAARAELVRRQLAEYAGTLAATLKAGDACAVCGAVEHLAKAELSESRVTEADLAQAEADVRRALKADEESAGRVTRLRERHAHATEKAEGADVDSLTEQIAQAREVLRVCLAAVEELEALTARRSAVNRRITDAGLAIERAKEIRHLAQTDVTVLQSAYETKREAVERGRGAHASIADHLRETRAHLELTRDLLRATERCASARESADAADRSLSDLLEKYAFASSEQVAAARLSASERHALTAKVAGHAAALSTARETLADPDLKDLPAEPVDLEPLKVRCEAADAEDRAASTQLGEVTSRAAQVTSYVEAIRTALAQAGAAQQKFEVVDGLARVVRGQSPNTRKMTLETFALAADLEEIIAAANVLLARMTSHRYELKYSDEVAKGGAQSGLSIDVVDAYNSETRSPRSLSGGEKFQASLALALGLAEVVTGRNGGVRLDTLFIDEGFGALDPETLDITLDTIDSLREGGRTVGLISHVDQVKERIPHHLRVTVTPEGWSRIQP